MKLPPPGKDLFLFPKLGYLLHGLVVTVAVGLERFQILFFPAQFCARFRNCCKTTFQNGDLLLTLRDLPVPLLDTSSSAAKLILASALVQYLQGVFESGEVAGFLDQVRQLDLEVIPLRLVRQDTLADIGTAFIGIRTETEQFIAEVSGKIRTRQVGGQVGEGEGILALLGTEKALYAVALTVCFKAERAAKVAALSRLVALALVIVQLALGRLGQSVQHRLDKDGKRAFALAVGGVDRVQPVGKFARLMAKYAEIRNFTGQQLHTSGSSPRKAPSPVRMTRSFSSSDIRDASTSRMNSPLSDTSPT